MNRLDELIQELCPNGVEYVPIGTVVDYEQPSKYIVKSTDYNDDFETPVLTAGQSFILGYTNEEDNIYNASKENPVIIFDDFTGAFKWVDFPFKVKSSAMKMLHAKPEMTTLRYVFHVMGHLNYSSSEHKRLWIGIYSDFEIPLPPLEVQREIVRILDNFTELTAELTARKKQYEFYRDKLLSFDTLIGGARSDIHWTVLSKIADIGTGSSNTDEGLEEGLYPFYVRSPEPLRKNEYEYDETAIITAGDGVGVGKVYHYVEGKYALHQRAYRIHINTPDVMPRYYYHYMRSAFLPYIQKTMYHGSVASIRRPMLNEFPVPVPPLDVQERLVHVLDNFDAICSDLKIGLPAEIEARQKQYEFYRDKLLTFDIASATISGQTDRQTDRRAD
ncbi:MAG: restriction endonuclease subunit S [Clostridiales bacterium]|nr:restriction endonuclease subunit S [Clostridiales bacterium]